MAMSSRSGRCKGGAVRAGGIPQREPLYVKRKRVQVGGFHRQNVFGAQNAGCRITGIDKDPLPGHLVFGVDTLEFLNRQINLKPDLQLIQILDARNLLQALGNPVDVPGDFCDIFADVAVPAGFRPRENPVLVGGRHGKPVDLFLHGKPLSGIRTQKALDIRLREYVLQREHGHPV